MKDTRDLIANLPEIADLPLAEVRNLLLGVARVMDGVATGNVQTPGTGTLRLRITTLGRFSIDLDGQPLDFARKRPKKPLQLLKAIIARGGRNVCINTLCEDLWPDADGATAIQSLNVTLHRLRKLLVVKDALSVNNGSISLETAVCRVDAQLFEQSVAQMDGHSESQAGASDGSVARFDAALDLYQGAFLPEEESPWATILRERLRSKFVRAVRAYAARCEQMDQRELAIPVYERAIEIDPLAEELYRQLMTVHASYGRPADAVALYRRCRVVLGKLLGVEPAVETRQLYNRIQKWIEAVAEARALADCSRQEAGNRSNPVGLDTIGSVDFTPAAGNRIAH